MKTRNCPHCQTSQASEDRKIWPFCSDRCKIADLGNWAAERYKIPVKEDNDNIKLAGEIKNENED